MICIKHTFMVEQIDNYSNQFSLIFRKDKQNCLLHKTIFHTILNKDKFDKAAGLTNKERMRLIHL